MEQSDLGVNRTLKQIGVSKSSFYEWYRRYLEDGYDGLSSKSKRPNQFWNRIPDQERKKFVDYALDHTWLSCREVAVEITDKHGYFISESSVYRILKAAGLITSPAYAIQSAVDEYQHKTTRVNELWQTDFTFLKIVSWGWYYLSTILDDYSRKILAWKLCTQMTAEEVTLTLNMAISKTGVKAEHVEMKPRLLSDNGSCYISKHLKKYLKVQEMNHSRGRPFHPQTQGKIERYHRSMKTEESERSDQVNLGVSEPTKGAAQAENILLLYNYYLPQELEARIAEWVDYYNNRRYHESLWNITPSDKYAGREKQILRKRRKIKERTIQLRRKMNGFTIRSTGTQIPVSVS